MGYIQGMITDKIHHLDEKFFKNRFAAEYFGYSGILRGGNIIAFASPVTIRKGDVFTTSDQALNFVMELPALAYDELSTVMLKRLMLLSIGQITHTQLGYQTTQSLDDIIITHEHRQGGIIQNDGIANISRIYSCCGARLVYIGIHNKAGDAAHPRAYSLGLNAEQATNYMTQVISAFYTLTHDMFYRTCEISNAV